ncbi:MAG TPA: nuclear transport factor 2 family protein [Blastocatellia bacterium]|nr:nuclear transport factor 2 family protein [Blastocatellia bacterium]
MKRSVLVLAALLLFNYIAFTQENKLSTALASLVETERAFARTSVEKGIRDAFLPFFADDGINFQPHPTNTKEAFSKRPATRASVTLNWEPVFGDVSAAGDLGYTTGPYRLTDDGPEKRPTQHGFFFSIWKKQPDGNWRVAVDFGIQTPADYSERLSFQPARQATMKRAPAGSNPEAERAALTKTDRQFSELAKTAGMAKAFLSYLSDDARIYRGGLMPFIGKRAADAFLAQREISATWNPMKSDVSKSNDLGYTYGGYELKEMTGEQKVVERGYYVRVWKRDEQARWKVVADISNRLPR